MNTAVLVLIINKNKNEFLSVSLKNDHSDFNLPGGKVEHNETYIQTGIREVKEETGIDIYNLHYLYKDLDNDFEVITYYTFDYQGNIYTNENHIVKWLPIYDLNKSKKWSKYNSMIYNKYIDLPKHIRTRKITKSLERKNHTFNGKKFTNIHIRRIVRNPFYKGDISYGEMGVKKHPYPNIVSPRLFNKVSSTF